VLRAYAVSGRFMLDPEQFALSAELPFDGSAG